MGLFKTEKMLRTNCSFLYPIWGVLKRNDYFPGVFYYELLKGSSLLNVVKESHLNVTGMLRKAAYTFLFI